MERILFNLLYSICMIILTFSINILFVIFNMNSIVTLGLGTYFILCMANCAIQFFIGKSFIKFAYNAFATITSITVVPVVSIILLAFSSKEMFGLLFYPYYIFMVVNNLNQSISFICCICFFTLPVLLNIFAILNHVSVPQIKKRIKSYIDSADTSERKWKK